MGLETRGLGFRGELIESQGGTSPSGAPTLVMNRVVIGALAGAIAGFILGSMVLTVSPEFKILGSVAGTIVGAIAGDLEAPPRP
jgi:hypothetical protein